MPDNASAFVESVKGDAAKLIDLGVWDIATMRFSAWFKQFKTEEDRFFGACLVDQIIFRTAKQFDATLNAHFRGALNRVIVPNGEDGKLIDLLRSRSDPGLRLVPVIREDDPPTKSGPLVLRRVQKATGANSDWMVWPWQVASNANSAKTIVLFIDDFLGTGRQFEKFYTHWRFGDVANVEFVYAPIAAHRVGMDALGKKFPDLRICPAEELDQSHGFFSSAVWDRLGQGVVTADHARFWYDSFTKANLRPLRDPNGKGALALTYAFSHSTPNNSLPLLWATQEGKWLGLLER